MKAPRRAPSLIRLLLLGLALLAGIGVEAAERTRLADLTLPDLDGTPQALAQWRGRVLVVNFWATWCAPCRYEIPDLVQVQEKYGPAGLQIVGIGVDEVRPLRQLAKDLGVNYPVLVLEPGTGGELLQALGNPQALMPYTVILDREGAPLADHLGALDRRELEGLVRPLLRLGD